MVPSLTHWDDVRETESGAKISSQLDSNKTFHTHCIGGDQLGNLDQLSDKSPIQK
jgi:hypothetical protein